MKNIAVIVLLVSGLFACHSSQRAGHSSLNNQFFNRYTNLADALRSHSGLQISGTVVLTKK